MSKYKNVLVMPACREHYLEEYWERNGTEVKVPSAKDALKPMVPSPLVVRYKCLNCGQLFNVDDVNNRVLRRVVVECDRGSWFR